MAVQVFKAYDMTGKFLAGPVSVIDFFGSQLGGRFTNAACAPPIMLFHSILIEITDAILKVLNGQNHVITRPAHMTDLHGCIGLKILCF